jgi:acetoin:2,6-dichlorophenolindophenol oxidoreductase subunit alpha
MNLTADDKRRLYRNLVRARAFDRLFASLLARGKLLGFFHRGEGGEAPGVGACTFLRQDDMIWPHLRGHGLPHLIGKGIDPKYYLAEHMGKSTGYCGGVSTFHCCAPEQGMYGLAGTIGSGFPVSVGWGLAAKMNGRGQVIVTCFGDGTSNRGTLHEALLMSANWKLPIVWVCENNGLAIYVPAHEHHPMQDVASLAPGYGLPFQIVDGQDVIAVAQAVMEAVERARVGGGPSFVECKTARFYEHDIGSPDLVGTEPRTAEMIERLRQRDPLKLCCERLMAEGILTQQDVEQIDREAKAEAEAAEQFAMEGLMPDPASLDQMLYAD